MTTHKVTAPVVIAKTDQGSDIYVYRDGVVSGQSDEWVKRHETDGMIVELDEPDDATSGDGSGEPTPDPFEAFLDRPADEVIDDIPSLTPEDLAAVEAAETDGKGRVTILRALSEAKAATSGDGSGDTE